MGRRPSLPAAAGVAVLLVIAGALSVRAARSPERTGASAPPLHLTPTTAPTGPAAGPGRPTEIRSRGMLPRARPPAAPVRLLAGGAAPAGTVRRLAAALGLPVPRRDGTDWVAGSGERMLRVTGGPGRPWRFAVTDAPVSTAAPPASDLCAADARKCWPPEVPLRLPAPADERPGDDQARHAAAPILAAVGLSPDAARVREGVVTVDPIMAGLPTTGLPTTVAVDRAGRVRAASGWLASTRPGPGYPLVSATRAFALLKQDAPKRRPSAVTVTGAQLGLTLRYDEGRPLLVPAWLFAAAGVPEPLVRVAVDPAFLRPPQLPGASAVPGAPAARPARVVRWERAVLAPDGRELRVRPQVWGLGCGTRFTAGARETATEVVVRVVSVPPVPGYHAYVLLEPTVRLRAPLGPRVLRDAFDGGIRQVTTYNKR